MPESPAVKARALLEQAASLWLQEHPWVPGTPTSENSFLYAAECAHGAVLRAADADTARRVPLMGVPDDQLVNELIRRLDTTRAASQ